MSHSTRDGFVEIEMMKMMTIFSQKILQGFVGGVFFEKRDNTKCMHDK